MRYITAMFLTLTSCSYGQIGIYSDWSDAINLEIGNFWVYEMSIIQLPSNERNAQPIDSIFIREDSLINETQYFHLENLFGLSELKRDSAGFLVDPFGQKEFSVNFDKDTLWQSDDIIVLQSGRLENVKVPAGNFVSAVVVSIQKTPAGLNIPESNPAFFNKQFVIINKSWYVRGIGVVKSVDYYGGLTAFEKSLKRFNVKQSK